jgi:hypothetical protein
VHRRIVNALIALITLITLTAPATLLALPLGVAPRDDDVGTSGSSSAAYAPAAYAQSGPPPLPNGWPSTLQLGKSDGPGGAAAMRARAPFGFRYQYLAGGVVPGSPGGGWATWDDPPGQYANYYIDDSIANGMTPVFSYYMIFQSQPGVGGDEQRVVLNNLNNAATMQAYFADLKLFFQRAQMYPGTKIVLHVEPDMWGYVQQAAGADNAASVAAKVHSSGFADVAGLPDNVAGLAQAVVRLRNQTAPNVILGYHVSVWGTNVDIAFSDPTDAQVDALGDRAGAFYNSLGASFDVAFGEFSDRDSAYMQLVQNKGPQSWWNGEDFRRHARFISRFVATSGKRMVLWQIPYGNTKMRAMNNTKHHYQDNRVEWLLDEPARTHLTAYVDAGVIGFLFGGGNGDGTDASDAAGDGITNPPAINGNDTLSYSADDDGGFFHNRAAAYYTAGAMSLPGGAPRPPTATPTPPTATPTPPTATPTPTPTLPPVACNPRPAVLVNTTPSSGSLQVGITATGPNNRLLALQVSKTTNALVDVAGQSGRSGAFTVSLPGSSASATFTIRRASAGAATVSLTVVDRCGTWSTFVGGGPAAF